MTTAGSRLAMLLAFVTVVDIASIYLAQPLLPFIGSDVGASEGRWRRSTRGGDRRALIAILSAAPAGIVVGRVGAGLPRSSPTPRTRCLLGCSAVWTILAFLLEGEPFEHGAPAIGLVALAGIGGVVPGQAAARPAGAVGRRGPCGRRSSWSTVGWGGIGAPAAACCVAG